MLKAPSGDSFEIAYGDQHAIVTEVGATLRAYTANGQDVIDGFAADTVPQGCQGQHLLPWPNRIRDGRYVWDSVPQQLAISEPERGNAIHGLVNWVPWQLAELYPASVTLRTTLYPQPGWVGTLDLSVIYTLGDDGLAVEVSATNVGAGTVPFGYAAHPYLTLGIPIDEIGVTAPFDTQVAVDERLLPTGIGSIRTPLGGAKLGSLSLDTAFGSPTRDQRGRWHVRLSSAGRACSLWADRALGWVQLYTPDDRLSLAVEPMTCPADAFNPGPTHGALITLTPGERFCGTWGINPRA